MFRAVYNSQPILRKAKPILLSLQAKKLSTDELLDALKNFLRMTFVKRSYSINEQEYTLKALVYKYGEELPSIYSQIAGFVLENETGNIPLFFSGTELEHVFSKKDILLMMCMMTLFLVPPQPYEADKKRETSFNHLKNFAYIFTHIPFKTVGIVEYLKAEINNKNVSAEKLALKRIVTQESIKQIIDKNKQRKMSQFLLAADEDSIQNHYGALKVDFANKYIGGGSLIHGSVQQQIMFAVHPEMYTSMLLCEKMEDNEAIVYKGYKKYFSNTGYGYGVALTGFNDHNYQYSKQGMAIEYVTAIDAIDFGKAEQSQYSVQAVNRQILKSYTGFNVAQMKVIATGNWGCGVFGGDLQLKLLVQWISASMLSKKIIYCPFGKAASIGNLELFLKQISRLPVGEVYTLLMSYVEQTMKKKKEPASGERDLFESLLNKMK